MSGGSPGCGTIVINHTLPASAVAAVRGRLVPFQLATPTVHLDYDQDMGLVRVSTPQSPPNSPAANSASPGSPKTFHHPFSPTRRAGFTTNASSAKNIVITSAPNSPTKVIRRGPLTFKSG